MVSGALNELKLTHDVLDEVELVNGAPDALRLTHGVPGDVILVHDVPEVESIHGVPCTNMFSALVLHSSRV